MQVAARQRGRPFNNVLELLSQSDEEHEEVEEVKLSPEEQLLRDLVNLAITIRDDGQVNPLTVVDISQGVTHQFGIETAQGKIRNASGFLIDGARVSWRFRHPQEKTPVYQRRSRRKRSAQ